MEWDLKTIGIVLAVFFIGYIIGLVEAAIKQRHKDSKKNLEAEKISTGLPFSGEVKTNLLSVNRDEAKGLVLELGGQSISNKDDLTPENRRKLVNLLVEIRPWLEGEPPLIQSTPSFQKKPEPKKSEPRFVPTKPESKPVPASQEKPKPTGDSMVCQINEILQTRLAGTPLASQGIRLQESITGSVLVFVGLQKYEGVDSVPDPEVKDIIRQSVAEWEHQN